MNSNTYLFKIEINEFMRMITDLKQEVLNITTKGVILKEKISSIKRSCGCIEHSLILDKCDVLVDELIELASEMEIDTADLDKIYIKYLRTSETIDSLIESCDLHGGNGL